MSLPPSQQAALDLLEDLGPIVPIPSDALACVAAGVSKDPDLSAELKAARKDGEVPDGVMDLGAGCMQELHALPAFLEGLEDTAAGGLSERQRACVEKGYLALDPEVLEAATADALGESRGAGAAGEIKSMLRKCGVKVGG